MSNTLAIRLANDLEELDRLSEALESFCTEQGFSPAQTYSLELALDEIVSNIIQYGAFDDIRERISILIRHDGDTSLIRVEDDGVAFNPLTAAPPELDVPLEERERPVGGLGIHIVSSVMDRVEYVRRDGKNILEMEKGVTPECRLEE